MNDLRIDSPKTMVRILLDLDSFAARETMLGHNCCRCEAE